MPHSPPPSDNAAAAAPPVATPRALFLTFAQLALLGFGGVLPWAHRMLVEKRRWLTQREFVETLAMGQLLPGPNIGNMAVMIAYRFAGYRGVAAAYAGLFGGPFLLMIGLGMLYGAYGSLPLVQHALSGMSAVAAGLVLSTGLKMAGSMKSSRRPWLFALLTLAGVGALRWPLLAVLGILGPVAIIAAWRKED